MRRQQRLLQAQRVTAAQTVELVDGTPHAVRPGDWLILAGKQIIDWAHAESLEDRYEIVPQGVLILSAVERAQIDQVAGLGSTRTGADLVKAIDRLAHIEIGTVKIGFTPGQLEEITHRASKRGYSVEQELRRIIDRIKDEIFYRS